MTVTKAFHFELQEKEKTRTEFRLVGADYLVRARKLISNDYFESITLQYTHAPTRARAESDAASIFEISPRDELAYVEIVSDASIESNFILI